MPTPDKVVRAMLEMGDAGPGDLHYDLGSGDGRLVVAAVQAFGVEKSVGIDINPRRVREGRQRAKEAGIGERARFIQGDLFKQDLSEADVLTLYLSPQFNRRLRPRILDQMAPGSRVVSHDFRMGAWMADAQREVGKSDVFMWVVPADVAGAWRGTAGDVKLSVDFRQNFQQLDGLIEIFDRRVPLRAGRLEGRALIFTAFVQRGGKDVMLRFEGRVTEEGSIKGRLEVGDDTRPVRLSPVG